MKFSPTEEKPCRRVFKVELNGPDYQGVRGAALARIASQADIPGFRRGKIPEQILEQRYGKAVEEETVEEAVSRGARHVIEQTGLMPVTNPTVSSVARTAEGMTFSLTIELPPEVNMGEYQALEFARDAIVVRPEDIDAVVEGLRRRFSSYEDVDRPARWGDVSVVDYEGTLGGQTFEGGSAHDVMVAIGTGQTLREIENELVGHKTGDVFEVDAAFPADHASKELAGKTARFSVTVKGVKSSKVPDLDDEFAKSMGAHETVEQMRQAVRERLKAEREREAQERLRARVADRISRFTGREVAPSLVEEEMRYMAVRGAEQLARRGMRSIQQLGMKEDDFREMFRPAALRAVREAFALDAVATKENITVDDQELEKEVKASGGEEHDFNRTIAQLKSDGRWERLRVRLRQDRTLDWIIGKSTVVEREIRI